MLDVAPAFLPLQPLRESLITDLPSPLDLGDALSPPRSPLVDAGSCSLDALRASLALPLRLPRRPGPRVEFIALAAPSREKRVAEFEDDLVVRQLKRAEVEQVRKLQVRRSFVLGFPFAELSLTLQGSAGRLPPHRLPAVVLLCPPVLPFVHLPHLVLVLAPVDHPRLRRSAHQLPSTLLPLLPAPDRTAATHDLPPHPGRRPFGTRPRTRRTPRAKCLPCALALDAVLWHPPPH